MRQNSAFLPSPASKITILYKPETFSLCPLYAHFRTSPTSMLCSILTLGLHPALLLYCCAATHITNLFKPCPTEHPPHASTTCYVHQTIDHHHRLQTLPNGTSCRIPSPSFTHTKPTNQHPKIRRPSPYGNHHLCTSTAAKQPNTLACYRIASCGTETSKAFVRRECYRILYPPPKTFSASAATLVAIALTHKTHILPQKTCILYKPETFSDAPKQCIFTSTFP